MKTLKGMALAAVVCLLTTGSIMVGCSNKEQKDTNSRNSPFYGRPPTPEEAAAKQAHDQKALADSMSHLHPGQQGLPIHPVQ